MSSKPEKKIKKSKKKGKSKNDNKQNDANPASSIKLAIRCGSDNISSTRASNGAGQASSSSGAGCYKGESFIEKNETGRTEIQNGRPESRPNSEYPVVTERSDRQRHQRSAYQLNAPGSGCVLELHCVCAEGSESPLITEQYNARLIRSTEYGERGVRIEWREYLESAAQSSRGSSATDCEQLEAAAGNINNNATRTTTSRTSYSEQSSTATYRTGEVCTEKSIQIEESHEATTERYEIVDDRLIKSTLTKRRRSSVSRASKATTSSVETNEMAAAKDKYIVSFNSDTSDSEEEESGDEAKQAAVKLGQSNEKSPLTSGKAEAILEPNSASQKPAAGVSGLKSAGSGSDTTKGESGSKPRTSNGPILDLISGDDIPIGACLGSDSQIGQVQAKSSKADTATDILVDLSGTTSWSVAQPEVATGTRKSEDAAINPELEGLTLSFMPKPRPDDEKVNERKPDRKTRSGVSNNIENPSRTRAKAILNGISNDVDDMEIINDNVYAVKNNHKTDILDADILIYTSPGSIGSNKSARETEYRKSKSFDSELQANDSKVFRSGTYERQTSNPEERARSKKKYDDLDEKFSAICSKYGKEPKRDKHRNLQDTKASSPSADLSPGKELYGMVRVKTGSLDDANGSDQAVTVNAASCQHRGVNKDPVQIDSGCTTPRQKITFDDMVKWDRSSTDELIKRILADAHDTVENNIGARKSRGDMATTSDKSRDGYGTGRRMPEPYEKEMGGDKSYGQPRDQSPSLLERRLASLAGSDKHPGSAACTTVAMYKSHETPPNDYDDDEPEQLYKRKSGGSRMSDLDDDTWSLDSAGSGRYVPWKQRQKALTHDHVDNMALAIRRRCDDSDSDNESYVSSRRAHVPVLPDDYFKPEKSEETDAVVRERTSEARSMVDNQAEVLGRLKKASDSFDELDAEIRELKKQVIENNVARQSIIEDIIADIQENSVAIVDEEPPITSPLRYTRSSFQRSDNCTLGYSSSYSGLGTRYGRRSRDTESCSRFDIDLESDKLGGYALGAVAKSKWGEPGGSRAFRSASVCRFDDVENEKYDKYGLYNTLSDKRWSTSGDNFDVKSDYGIEAGDDADTASIRSYPSEKSSGDRSEEADTSSTSSTNYRSRYALSKYGSTSSALDWSSRHGNSTYTRSSRPSRSSSLYRSCTVGSSDYSYERLRVRAGSMPPPEPSKPFTSRFLSKVREKRASGEYTKPSRDKPFKSRFLGRSFDSDYYSASSSSRASLASTPDSSSPRSQRSRDNDVTSAATNEGEGAAAETGN